MGKKDAVVEKKKKRGGNRAANVILFLTLLIVVIMGGFSFSYTYIMDMAVNNVRAMEVKIPTGTEQAVDIPIGSSTSKIADILKTNGIIKNIYLFKMLSSLNGFDGTYKAGVHVVSKELGYTEVMVLLTKNPESLRVTIPEGNTTAQIADALFSKKIIDDKARFMKALNSTEYKYKFLEGLSKRNVLLEGYLFPDTYEFGMKAKDSEIINIMLSNFEDRFKSEYNNSIKALNVKYPKLGLTVDKIITLASIVEREAKLPEERARIAGVFYNRLNGKYGSVKMLQSCATLQYIYSTRDTGISDADKARIMKGIIKDTDTKIDDPYNTYKYEGLPAGPICNPGKAAIEAALNPEDNRYLFFVVKKDGNGAHVFSETQAQHDRATRENQVE